MNLHENKQLFADAILAASQSQKDGGLGIKQIFLEKDYWITRSLKLLSESQDAASAVFKGGTSLSKAYGLGARFSEDIDIAITQDQTRTENQTKALISRIAHSMSVGLEEKNMPDTRKYSKYRKVYYSYPQIEGTGSSRSIKPGLIQLELVSFSNPYPFQGKVIGSLLRDYLLSIKRNDIIQEYRLEEFTINVLDIRRTATEKVVSLIRRSLADDYPTELRAKIRYFYDLHFLWQDDKCQEYLRSPSFFEDFERLFSEDQSRFTEPSGWQNRKLMDSPLLKDFSSIWDSLEPIYESELPELAYRDVPSSEKVFASVSSLFDLLK